MLLDKGQILDNINKQMKKLIASYLIFGLKQTRQDFEF